MRVAEIAKQYQAQNIKPITKESADIIKRVSTNVDILLKGLSAEPQSANSVRFAVENSKIFKNQTVGYDLSTLKNLAQNDPKLNELFSKIEDMLSGKKPTINLTTNEKGEILKERIKSNVAPSIVENSSQVTKQKIDQSGVFFENNLKNAVLPSNEKTLFLSVVKNIEAFLKDAPLPKNSQRQVNDLLDVLKNSPKSDTHAQRYEVLSKALDTLLTQAKSNAQNQPLFPLLEKANKVELLTTSKDLTTFKTALKELINEIKNPQAPLPKEINEVSLRRFEQLKNQITQSATTLEPLLEKNSIEEILTAVRTKELNFNQSSINWQTAAPQTHTSLSPNLEVSDKLKIAIQNIKNSIAQLSPKSVQLPQTLEFASKALTQLNELENPEPKLNDLKQSVMQLKEATTNREVISTCNKIISQIEMNQLYSITTNSIYTFSPYMWDGVKKGNLRLKNDNEKSYCQISLDFVEYKKVNVLLGLFESKYLHVNFSFESKKLENIALENLSELKKLISGANILLSSVSIVPFVDNNFFENDNLKDEFGIDTRA